MSLRETTRSIIRLVEERSGFSVIVTEDASIPLLANVRMARGAAAVHTITYNPSGGTAPDYLVCYQCGFILRFFASPPDQRFDLAGAPRGREIVGNLLRSAGAKIPAPAIDGLRDRFFDGLMTQLRSVPVGLRVDSWIMQHHADLADLQRAAVERQLQENLATLGPDVRKIAPRKVYESSVSMNAAFAQFWARTWDDSRISSVDRRRLLLAPLIGLPRVFVLTMGGWKQPICSLEENDGKEGNNVVGKLSSGKPH